MSRHTDVDARRGRVNTTAAEIYETFFVPALFGQFPQQVLDHAGVRAGDAVLDVGCGTGIVASTALEYVGSHGHVAGVDPNEGMLAVARRSRPSIDWHIGSAESLPFDDGSFDRTITQFAAMFFDDHDLAMQEMARTTHEGGSVTVATWCGLERTPGYDAMVDLIADEISDQAADALRAPFTLGEQANVESLLQPIGSEMRVDLLEGIAHFPSIADWVHTDVRGWTLSDLVDDEAEALLVARAERDLAAFVSTDGTVRFPAPAWVGTALVAR
jgi:SAM-dependent methyltransferase